MAGKYLFLGFPLTPVSPSPPAIPAIKLSPFLTIEKDEACVTLMELTSHTGTHLDTPGHVIEDGLRLTDFEVEDFVFNHPLVIDLPLGDGTVVQPEHLEPFVEQGQDADMLLVRFGFGRVRRSEPARFSKRSPGFGVESAQFLRDRFPGLRALGMDVPSLSCIEHLDMTFKAHHVLLGGPGRKFLVIEDMDLEKDLSGLKQVFVAPLLVERIDGAPCTVLGILNP